MNDRVCIILASGDRDVLKWGLRYAWKSTTEKYLEDIKVIIFGPSEKVIAQDKELQESARRFMDLGKDIIACKACSDEEGVSDKLAELGIKVEYVGSIIGQAIKEGYVPMVW